MGCTEAGFWVMQPNIACCCLVQHHSWLLSHAAKICMPPALVQGCRHSVVRPGPETVSQRAKGARCCAVQLQRQGRHRLVNTQELEQWVKEPKVHAAVQCSWQGVSSLMQDAAADWSTQVVTVSSHSPRCSTASELLPSKRHSGMLPVRLLLETSRYSSWRCTWANRRSMSFTEAGAAQSSCPFPWHLVACKQQWWPSSILPAIQAASPQLMGYMCG